MKRPKIQRPVKTLERQWPWLLLALLLGSVLVSATALLGLGVLDKADPYWFGRNFRGYTAVGLTMGVLSIVLTVLCVAYSVRKRRAASGSATMMTWLWVHVYFGILATFAAVLHAGFGI